MNNEIQLAIAELELVKIKAALSQIAANGSREMSELLGEAIVAVGKAQNRILIERCKEVNA